ncbi:MAG: tol-pal system protein YbgF [Steroidobacteraceae bacterium]
MKSFVSATALSAILLLAGCTTVPEDDPMQTRLDDLDSRVGRIDRVVSNQSLVQLQQRVEILQGDLRTLRGEIDELQNSNEALRKQQRDLYADLDQRLKAAPVGGGSFGGASASVAAGDEQSSYNRAFDLLKAADFTGAIAEFTRTAAAYPQGSLADNTQYWLGEAYYVTRDYDNANAAFQRVLTRWPDSRKAPDALLKMGLTQLEQKRPGAARSTLRQVTERYPGSDAARIAGERLQKIPADAR